ncbi:hypothetical protein ACSVDA_06585 [Cytobacillus sp. Hm23]
MRIYAIVFKIGDFRINRYFTSSELTRLHQSFVAFMPLERATAQISWKIATTFMYGA